MGRRWEGGKDGKGEGGKVRVTHWKGKHNTNILP